MGLNPQKFLIHAWSSHRLTFLVTVSLIVHALAWGAVLWTGVLDPAINFSKKDKPKRKLSLEFIQPKPASKPVPPPPVKKVQPSTFVQVEPKNESAEKPEDADKYSNKNSQAANPEPGNQNKAKVDGDEAEAARTRDIPQPSLKKLKPLPRGGVQSPGPKHQDYSISNPSPSRPAPSRTQPAGAPKKIALPKQGTRGSTPKTANLSLSNPVTEIVNHPSPAPLEVRLDPGPPPPKKESPLQRAKRRLGDDAGNTRLLPGEATHQEGGAPRKGTPRFNVMLTGYGDYDEKLITAIYHSWIRKNHDAKMLQPYRVVIEFTLRHDGRIENLRVSNGNTALSSPLAEFVCQRSIEEPAPFEKWNDRMKLSLGDHRPCRITFSFNLKN